MPAQVILTVIHGTLTGRRFAFAERTTCILGRAADCQPRLPDDTDHREVGRHHCLLDINPPDVRIRDLGSLNGTYLNDRLIGRRGDGMEAPPENDVHDGDRIRLGKTVLQVRIIVPAVCGDCGAEIPEGQQAAAAIGPGLWQCPACRAKGDAAPGGRRAACVRCGADIRDEIGTARRGDYVCARCREQPLELTNHALAAAAGGDLPRALGEYEVLHELGRGGMGVVYLVRHKRTGEPAALKMMLPQVAVEPWAAAAFLRETENTRALRHPHVVRFYDADCREGVFLLLLEYCDGGSAEQLRRRRGGTLPVDEAVPIILHALDGLEHAHQAEIPQVRRTDGCYARGRGLVHRDVKPGNLLLCGAGGERVAKVADYGLAKAFDLAGLSGQTRTGDRAGAPAFLPRQQVVNFKYAQPEVDVWAAAASLYCLLTGRTPRDFPEGRDKWQVVLETDAKSILERVAEVGRRDVVVPPKLADVIDAALVDRPAIAFKTAAALRRALEGAL